MHYFEVKHTKLMIAAHRASRAVTFSGWLLCSLNRSDKVPPCLCNGGYNYVIVLDEKDQKQFKFSLRDRVFSSSRVTNNKKRNSFKPERKQLRFDTKWSTMTEEEVIPEESFGSDFGFKELGMMMKSFKEQTSLQFDRLSTTIMEIRLQLQEQIKYVHDDVADVKTSINGAWIEIEAFKNEMPDKTVVIDQLEKTVKSLQASLKKTETSTRFILTKRKS